VVLVDTSVWIDHLRQGLPSLQKLLLETSVMCHPMVIGELACGNLKNRKEVVNLLTSLPQAEHADLDEVLHFIDSRKLAGQGLSLVDAHLLASAVLAHVPLWTLDKVLAKAAQRLHLHFQPQEHPKS
jgi:predicted nucleic acid-binding protein